MLIGHDLWTTGIRPIRGLSDGRITSTAARTRSSASCRRDSVSRQAAAVDSGHAARSRSAAQHAEPVCLRPIEAGSDLRSGRPGSRASQIASRVNIRRPTKAGRSGRAISGTPFCPTTSSSCPVLMMAAVTLVLFMPARMSPTSCSCAPASAGARSRFAQRSVRAAAGSSASC